MALPTQQAAATAAIGDYASFAAQLMSLYYAAKALHQRQATRNYTSTWAALPTAPTNADGSVGATDAAPVSTHPIVGQNVSSSDLSAVDGYGLNDFISFVEGTAAVSQADRRATYGKLVP